MGILNPSSGSGTEFHVARGALNRNPNAPCWTFFCKLGGSYVGVLICGIRMFWVHIRCTFFLETPIWNCSIYQYHEGLSDHIITLASMHTARLLGAFGEVVLTKDEQNQLLHKKAHCTASAPQRRRVWGPLLWLLRDV